MTRGKKLRFPLLQYFTLHAFAQNPSLALDVVEERCSTLASNNSVRTTTDCERGQRLHIKKCTYGRLAVGHQAD